MNTSKTFSVSRALAVTAVCLLLLSACKKTDDESDNNNGPDCDAAQSLLKSETTNANGSSTTVSYDAQGLKEGQLAIGTDTVLETDDDGATKNYYIFNSAGDQYLTHRVTTYPGDVRVIDFYYAYDSDHRLIKRWSYVNTNVAKGLQDSIAMIWQDGNLVQEKDLFSGSTLATYHYYTNRLGHNPRNIPIVSSRWLTRPGSKIALSKDYINTDLTEPTFDNRGRLKVLTSTNGGQLKLSFTYVCR
jgi:YD repeat-containing protein